jgi:hypothetical protein
MAALTYRHPMTATTAAPAAPAATSVVGRTSGRTSPVRCLWCGRELPSSTGVGRRRRYCAQACRQRAYENRNALERGAIPVDAVVFSRQERNDLADRLYQVRCAAEDVATALAESAGRDELAALVSELIATARSAERIR